MDYLAALKDLQSSSADVEGAMLVGMDGQLMASSIQLDNAQNAASRCAEALTLALDLASLTGRGNLDQVYIKAENGYMILMPVGTTALLVVLA